MVMASGEDGSARAAALLQRLVFRLDDGTVIRGAGSAGGPRVLKPAEAYEAGLLSEAHLLRAQALLCEVHAKLPDEGPLKSMSTGSKRSLDSVLEVGQTVSAKKSRSTGVPNGAAHHHPHEAPPAAAAAVAALESPTSPPEVVAPLPPVDTTPWQPRCLTMVDNVLQLLAGSAWIFFEPVNKAFVPDYYRIIKRPVCFRQIKERLQTGFYPGPQGFFEDVDLLFSNCFTYNKRGSDVHALGMRGEAAFFDEWDRSPFAGMTARTRPPGLPAAAPNRAPPKKQQHAPAPTKPSRSRQAAPRRQSAPKAAGHSPAGGVGGGAVARTKSVNSYRAYASLPADKQAALAEALQDERVLEEKMDGVVEILQRANELPTNEEGEVELDLSVLSPQTIWALYEFVLGGGGAGGAPMAAPAAPARPAHSSGLQLEQDSDYEPDEDEDD